MELGTYIRLFRKFKKWGWYKNSDTKSVFIHLLIEAEWNDTVKYGLSVKRGQFLTTESILMDELGLTRQQVRTALKHLISTNEITKEQTNVITNGRTNRMTLITIENYSVYQCDVGKVTKHITKPVTDENTDVQPRSNQPTIIKNNINNINNNINNIAHAREEPFSVDKNELPFGFLLTLSPEDRQKAQELRLKKHYGWEEIKALLEGEGIMRDEGGIDAE